MIKYYLSRTFQVTELVRHVSTEPVLLRGLLGDLAEWFAHSKRWNQRQTFALLCSQLVTKRVLSEELFACDVLPHLLDLSWDSVPNVRLSVARTIATNIMAQGEEFKPYSPPHFHALRPVVDDTQVDCKGNA
jgi:serine/threonine-protein phosphatase 4 regulatory subunit 1